MMEQEVTKVDCDLIKRLRLEGSFAEANDLLRAYQKNLDKSWAQGKREVKNIKTRISTFKKKREMREKIHKVIDGYDFLTVEKMQLEEDLFNALNLYNKNPRGRV